MDFVNKIIKQSNLLLEIEFSNDGIGKDEKSPKKDNLTFYKNYKELDFYTRLSKFYKTANAFNVFHIFKDKKYVGYIKLETKNKLPHVSEVFVNKDFRGKGIAFLIYEFLVENFGGVYSGGQQTPGSKQLWVKLANQYHVFFYVEGKYYKTSIKNNELISSKTIYQDDSQYNVLVCFKDLPKNIQIQK